MNAAQEKMRDEIKASQEHPEKEKTGVELPEKIDESVAAWEQLKNNTNAARSAMEEIRMPTENKGGEQKFRKEEKMFRKAEKILKAWKKNSNK